jgi:hydrogenase maturation protease
MSAAAGGVVVVGVGNRSRGDDALGPLLLERLGAWLKGAGRGNDVVVVEDFQLQIEHALDLAGRRLALFVDAGTGTRAPYEFRALRPADPGRSHTSHALAPEAVLGVYRQVNGEDPPPAFVLCVRGERFELGEDLSDAARAHLDAAWQRLLALCTRPEIGYWRRVAAEPVAPPSPRESASAAR